MLPILSLPNACRSATHALGREVLGAALQQSVRYDRAAGFFSSTVFTVSHEAFGAFFRRGGVMRLVCSPLMGVADIGAINRALVDRSKALADVSRAEELARRGESARAFSAWLSSGKVLIQIAKPSGMSLGIYHEKIGVFTDSSNNHMAISGSTNESKTAWMLNFERVDVFTSWAGDDAKLRCWRVQQAFEDLWSNHTPGLTVVPLHEAFLSGLLQTRQVSSIAEEDIPKGFPAPPPPPPELLAWPPDIHLFPHQEQAIRKWATSGGCGILAMATGAGKTMTALAIATQLGGRLLNGLVVLVIAPYIHLVDQWCDNARRWGLRPIRAAEARTSWEHDLAVGINAINAHQRPVLSIVVTQSTLVSVPRFCELLSRCHTPMLVIGDEAHNYGTRDTIAALPSGARYRLGLSATPERYRDPDGTKLIMDYFGEVVHRYDLACAIQDEVLTPYRYFPVRVELDPDELKEYLTISKQLAKYIGDGEEESGDEFALRLILKRARITASARQKLRKLEGLLRERSTDTHILVYCGDGQVEGMVPEEQQRQVDAAVSLIGNTLRMRCASYTASTSPERRRELLSLFAAGEIQVLVAIRCLDEGVDVPSTRTAIIMASSTNPRQFIQRRGRILRRSLGKTRADLFDFVVCPDLDGLAPNSSEYRGVRSMLQKEIARAAEFADLALNGPVARQTLKDITERLALFDVWYTAPPARSRDDGECP